MDIKTSLKGHGIIPNGIIHVGSNKGEMASYYHSEGVHKVMWIDKDHRKYKELYQACSPFGMDQLFFTAYLSNAEELDVKNTFKNLWRKHSAMLDIESYDLLCLDIKSDVSHVLVGFEDLLKLMEHVVVRSGSEAWVEKTLADAGFLKILQTSTAIIYKGKKRTS